MGSTCSVDIVSQNHDQDSCLTSETALSHEFNSNFEFKAIATIGTGTFSNVNLSKHASSGKYYAIKSVSINKVCRAHQSNYLIHSRTLLQIFNKSRFFPEFYTTFKDEFNLYYVKEFIPGGELFEIIQAKKCLSNKETIFYGVEMMSALSFLHDKNVIFRELVPENILIGSDGNIKICGGLYSKKLEIRTRTYTICGTPEYISPEMLKNSGYTVKTDFWSLGIILYEMFRVDVPSKYRLHESVSVELFCIECTAI